VSNGTPAPWGMSIDTVHDKLYWVGGIADDNPGLVSVIQRSNLDGSNVETVRITPATTSSPFGLVVNGATQHMYWTDRATGSVMRADLDGNDVQTIVTGTESMRALAIDFEHERIFWSETTSGLNSRILTAHLDGSGIQTIVSGTPIPPHVPGFEELNGLAVDPATRKLYFTANAGFGIGGVLAINYDGSELTTLIPQTRGPYGVALYVVPEPSTSVLGFCGLAAAAFVRRRFTA
jgi:DNA-binding beta-propeller fold protein YncE